MLSRAMRGRVLYALVCCLVLLAGLAVMRPAPARAADGDVDWTKDLNDTGYVTVAPGSRIVSQSCGTPNWQIASGQAFAPSGTLAWRFTDQLTHSLSICDVPPAVDHRGNTYFVDSDATGQGGRRITAVGSDGYIRWSVPIETTCTDHHPGVVKSLAIGTDGNVYATAIVTGSSCGTQYWLIGLDASDGDYLLRQELNDYATPPGGEELFAYASGLVLAQGPWVRYFDYDGDLAHDYTLTAGGFDQYYLRSVYAASSDGTVFVGSYFYSQFGLDCSDQNAVISKVTPSGGEVWVRQYATSTTCKILTQLRALPNGGVVALSFPELDQSSPGLMGVASNNSSTWTKSVVADQSGDSIRWATNMYVDTAGTIVTITHTQFYCNGGCDGVQIDRWDQGDGDTIGSSIVLEDTVSDPGSYYLSPSSDNNFAAIDSDRVYLSMTHCEGNNCQGGDPKLYAIEVGGLDPDYPSDTLIDSMPSTPFSPPSRQNLAVLGDSVASGEGINYGWYWDGNSWERVSSAEPDWEDSSISGQDCHLSFGSYPYLVASAANLNLDDFACTGAKALEGILKKQNQDADHAQLGKDAMGYDPPNDDYDSINDEQGPDYVTLTVGANDLDFPGFVTLCFLDDDDCDTTTNDNLVASRLANLEDHLETVLTEVQNRGEALNPDHVPTVILTTYYDPFPSTYTTCADIPALLLFEWEVDWLKEKLADLNDTIESVAAGFSNVQVVDLQDAMSGHEFCSSDPWVFGPSIKLSDIGSKAPYHPTPHGQQKVAELINQQIFES